MRTATSVDSLKSVNYSVKLHVSRPRKCVISMVKCSFSNSLYNAIFRDYDSTKGCVIFTVREKNPSHLAVKTGQYTNSVLSLHVILVKWSFADLIIYSTYNNTAYTCHNSRHEGDTSNHTFLGTNDNVRRITKQLHLILRK